MKKKKSLYEMLGIDQLAGAERSGFGDYFILEEDGQTPRRATPEQVYTWVLDGEPGRRVATDDVNGARISTVFLIFNHQWGEGDPVLWETMVLGGQFDLEERRYTSYADAVAGHAEMLTRVLTFGLDDGEVNRGE